MYKNIDRSIISNNDGHMLFQRVWEHVLNQLNEDKHLACGNEINRLPDAPRNIYLAFCLSSRVGGNGFEEFLLDSNADEIISCYKALKSINALKLLALFEAAIPLAEESESADYKDSYDGNWFSAFSKNSRYSSFDDVDREAMKESADPFSDVCAQYIRAHASEF